MPKSQRKKRPSSRKRHIEVAIPKRQHRRVNRLLYVVSAILLVVFGGGAALIGAGTPQPPPTPVPAVSPAPAIQEIQTGNPTQQPLTVTPTPASPAATPGQ